MFGTKLLCLPSRDIKDIRAKHEITPNHVPDEYRQEKRILGLIWILVYELEFYFWIPSGMKLDHHCGTTKRESLHPNTETFNSKVKTVNLYTEKHISIWFNNRDYHALWHRNIVLPKSIQRQKADCICTTTLKPQSFNVSCQLVVSIEIHVYFYINQFLTKHLKRHVASL